MESRSFIAKTIRKVLNEQQTDIVNTNIEAYHGSPIKFKKFSDMFVGGKQANDQEGPGIYFTTSYNEAKKYANENGFVYTVNLNANNLLSNNSNNKLNSLTNQVIKLIKMKKGWERVARGYSDDVTDGLKEIVERCIGMSQSEKEVFVSVYMEVYNNDARTYVKNMTKLGYDGIYLPSKDSGAHIVIYNPSTIELVKIEQI